MRKRARDKREIRDLGVVGAWKYDTDNPPTGAEVCVDAIAWYLKASDQGFEPAKQALRNMGVSI